MLRQTDIQLQIAQHQGGSKARHQNRAQQRGDYDVKQVIARIQSGDPNYQHDGNVYDSDAGNVEVESVANAGAGDAAGEIRHRSQSHDDG